MQYMANNPTSLVDQDSPAPTVCADHLGKKYTLFDRPTGRLLHTLSNGKWGRGREFWALQEVSFSVLPGQTLGIVGSNGSGKSTLLQLIAGTLKPTMGAVEANGRVAALLELGAGFNPELTGRENVQLSCALHGLSAELTRERLPLIEKFAEIGNFIDQPVKQYSSGMFVRLAFAVIAHVDADVMIIDEALAVGDAYYQQKCMRFMHAFMQRGTVLFVSHDMASIKSLCTDVLWLQGGRVMEFGPPKSVGDAYLRSQYARSQPVDRVSSAQTPPVPVEQVAIAIPSPQTMSRRDIRLPLMHQQGFESKAEIIRLEEPEDGFGVGDAYIKLAQIRDRNNNVLTSVRGGEFVQLSILAIVRNTIESPIFGFFVRNRMGLNVFGDNTALVYRGTSRKYQPGANLEACFEFVMPFLPRGDYSVCVALATGTNDAHVQQHWINEAFLLKSVSNDVHADVLGIPMHSISVKECDEHRNCN